jgi:hypothetical protein
MRTAPSRSRNAVTLIPAEDCAKRPKARCQQAPSSKPHVAKRQMRVGGNRRRGLSCAQAPANDSASNPMKARAVGRGPAPAHGVCAAQQRRDRIWAIGRVTSPPPRRMLSWQTTALR